jgi:hypothetical protein
MPAKLSTRLLGDDDLAHWTRFVSTSPDGSIYSTPAYLDILCQATGGRFRVLVAERGDELVGGVALYEERTRWGRHVGPRLLLYYNGIVLRPETTRYQSERTSRHLEAVAALVAAIASMGYARVVLRNRSTLRDGRALQAAGWSVAPAYSYVVPLADLAGKWNGVEQNLRRLIQRCATQGVVQTDDDDFDSFFRMHQETHRRKGAPLYLPQTCFRRYFERLRSANLCRLWHARLPDGRSISAQLVLLGPHPISHTAAAAQDAEFRNLGATAFLRWKALEELQRLGFAGNDLTDASLNPVTHFKAQLGGDLELNLLAESRATLGWRIGDLLRHGRDLARSLRHRGEAEA